MNTPVILAFSCDALIKCLERNVYIGIVDHGWLMSLSFGMWEHCQSYPDAEEDLRGWLYTRLPEFWNDSICACASFYGTSYQGELISLVSIITETILELVDIIQSEYSALLDPFIYDGGWTISKVLIREDTVYVVYHNTDVNQILSARESLLFRLDFLHKR